MYDPESPDGGAAVGTGASATPAATTAGRLQDGEVARRRMAAPSPRSGYVSCRVAWARDDALVPDVQAYLKLFCRRRALVESGDEGIAVHFAAADEAAVFSGLWTAWMAAGLVPDLAPPTPRCARELPNRTGEMRRWQSDQKSC